jgi:hypothetical protein
VSFVKLTNDNSTEFLQSESDDIEILWCENDKLEWSDFKGVPDTKSGYKAMTTSKLKTKVIQYNNEIVEYEILALFEKNKSWKKNDGKYLLAHEQIHFDISELVLRKMRQKFLNHVYVDLDGVNKMINSTFKEASEERTKLNRQYDEETEHGVHIENQNKWQKKVKTELDQFNEYSSIRVAISK